jgi:hypothetical protein
MDLRYTVHGFRSSFRDWAAETMLMPGEVAEAALAHAVPNRVEAAYRRTKFLEQRRKLMAAWSEFVCSHIEVLRDLNIQTIACVQLSADAVARRQTKSPEHSSRDTRDFPNGVRAREE